MTDELDKTIGTKEIPKLSAGSVIVKQVTIKTVPTKKGGKAKLVAFHIKHPDKEELIELSNMKLKVVQGNNETISKDGIWYYENDEEVNGKLVSIISLKCNAAKVMKFYNKTNLRQFENSSINTELDSDGYLTVKAY
jgi:hypothetical protein